MNTSENEKNSSVPSTREWQEIKDLFEAASVLDGKEREKFLDEACLGREDLRREIERLLGAFESCESFLEKPAMDAAAGLFDDKNTLLANHTTGNLENLVAGTILASRYRIIGLLGRGGMGEVYRAEDIKLSQTVALKFLPDKLEKEKAALSRFIGEVRTARSVAHANVCRVFDIGEVEGRHFISMEYVDGDDLSSLLRRVGRLPSERAIEISRQLCTGLYAIHEAGILHRDFKPANIIIDSKGKARITDFGIAGAAAEITKEEIRIGTPAYMSPEQITGKEISHKSDIYALGLVLYEIFTGKQAFKADSIPELIRKHQTEQPTNPSEFVKDIDPLVESLIFQCLQKNPANRPPSALHIAMALPGGNPLQVALEAGKTPSPEMVAAAPKKGALRPAVSLLLLAAVLLGIGFTMAISKRVALHRMVPLDKSPEVLRERSRELAEKFGYPANDSTYGFWRDPGYLNYLRDNDSNPTRWQKLSTGQPAVYKFWYRQSLEPLVPFSYERITFQDPPNNLPGMTQIYLDTRGRLLYFEAVPPPTEETLTRGAPTAFDWEDVFKEAGLSEKDFSEAELRGMPPARAFDERRAWTGRYTDQPDIPVRVEAAAYRGRLVQFEIIEPWTQPREQRAIAAYGSEVRGFLLIAIFFTVLIVGAWLAVKNVRGGRSDLRGATRVALFLFILRTINSTLGKHHVASIDEAWIIITSLQNDIFWSCFAGLLYLAFEPYLRKYAPDRVISWNRLLAGDWRDPLVGRDILLGGAIGLIFVALSSLRFFIPIWLGEAPVPYSITSANGAMLLGARGFPILFLTQTGSSLIFAFTLSFLVLFFSLLLRRNWLGNAAVWLLLFIFQMVSELASGNLKGGIFLAFLIPTVLVLTAVRFGVLATVAMFLFYHIVLFYPFTSDLSAWYSGDFLFCAGVLVALAVYGFYTSLAGQKIFETGFIKEVEG